MASTKQTRRQFFTDRWVQGGLISRAVIYWIYCVVAVTSLVLTWSILSHPMAGFSDHWKKMWEHFIPAAVASLFLLPIMALDMVRFSNRFAGPVFRLRNAMRRAAEGENVPPVTFRKGDYWQGMAEEFNELMLRVRANETRATEAIETLEGGGRLDESTLPESENVSTEDSPTTEEPAHV